MCWLCGYIRPYDGPQWLDESDDNRKRYRYRVAADVLANAIEFPPLNKEDLCDWEDLIAWPGLRSKFFDNHDKVDVAWICGEAIKKLQPQEGWQPEDLARFFEDQVRNAIGDVTDEEVELIVESAQIWAEKIMAAEQEALAAICREIPRRCEVALLFREKLLAESKMPHPENLHWTARALDLSREDFVLAVIVGGNESKRHRQRTEELVRQYMARRLAQE